MKASVFQKRIFAWYDKHGRKNLPWQKNISPYRVWVSEIMLQQTQVTTVLNYFDRFMQHFPNVHSLAQAPQDEVLHLWTGLGYYARARNLHRCAQMIVEKYAGQFPDNLDALQNLPGIGKSTANAILSIAFAKPGAILDGNVKRVLLRFFAIKEWYGQADSLKKLWLLAESLAPKTKTREYTQAMMDLGATICVRSKPRCSLCPLNSDCIARSKGLTAEIPAKKSKRILPIKSTTMVIMRNAKQEILLEKRQFTRLWGNLYSFPELKADYSLEEFCEHFYGYGVNKQVTLTTFRHTFSHFHLDITAILVDINQSILQLHEAVNSLWYHPDSQQKIGLSAPVKRLLLQLTEEIT